MSKIVSYIKEAHMPIRHFLPMNTTTTRRIDHGRIESSDEFVRLVEARELLARRSARSFEDLRCPICGTFGCEGC